MSAFLRPAAFAIVVAALALSVWLFWRWHTLLDAGDIMMHPFRFDVVYRPSWAEALPSVIPLLAHAAAVALLLLARANLRDPALLTPPFQAGKPAQIRHRLVSASALRSMAAVLIVCDVVPLVLALVALPLGSWTIFGIPFRTIVGISMMIEPIDVFGLVRPGDPFPVVRHTWLVMGVLLLASILIVVALYATARSINRPRTDQPGPARDRQ